MQSSNIATGSTLPSRSPTIERDRSSGTPLDSTSKPKTYDIRYFIFANDIQERWTGKTLGESSLDSFFEEASIYARGSDTLRIRFVLSSYQSGFRNRADNIGRGEEVEFSEMKDEFWAALKEGKANGITKFKLLLEPVLANQGGPESSLKVEDDSEMQMW